MILKKVGVLEHARPDSGLVVVAGSMAEPVRFPVDDIIAILEPEKEIDKSSHKSFHRAEVQAPQALWKFGRHGGGAVFDKKLL
jgi:hypothetical protein